MQMKPVDTRVLLFAIKLIGLRCAAFPVIIYIRKYAHHGLLLIAATLLFFGTASLLKYRRQASWVQKKSRLKSMHECEEQVSVPAYTK